MLFAIWRLTNKCWTFVIYLALCFLRLTKHERNHIANTWTLVATLLAFFKILINPVIFTPLLGSVHIGNPQPFNGLYGAGLAAEGSNNPEKANSYYQQLTNIANSINSNRPELETAKLFLKKQKYQLKQDIETTMNNPAYRNSTLISALIFCICSIQI